MPAPLGHAALLHDQQGDELTARGGRYAALHARLDGADDGIGAGPPGRPRTPPPEV
ncbi:hypothetical protein [Streptomyces sp. NPDC006132]|uniref:hypothetical protein n=1 Tax=Streptomyces sp. NPDC006132 TaxID=3156732 RepID=UPI0033FE8BB4